MKILHGILVYIVLVNVCVIARGRGGGGGRGGSRSGHSGRSSYGRSSHGPHSYHHVTSSRSHYTYNPPTYVYYTCRLCSSSKKYPVYKQQLPNYVYMYKESGGRYNNLLSGLAMYNLGRTVGRSHGYHSTGSGTSYTAHRDEKCSLQIIDQSHFEETEFPCFMISSFTELEPDDRTNTIDITVSQNDMKPDSDSGDPLEVTEEQECVLWRNFSSYNERYEVPCALLKKYSDTVRPYIAPVYIWCGIVGIFFMIYLCYCVCEDKTGDEEEDKKEYKKEYTKEYNKEDKKELEDQDTTETAPLNDQPIPSYRTN